MLEVRTLRAWHGAAQALFGVTLSVGPGELVVLQGLNGSGKSTLLQAIMGLIPRVEGSICYQGRSMDKLEPHQRARLGLGYVPEDRRLFTELSVRENLLLAARSRDGTGGIARNLDRVMRLFPALQAMLGRSAAHMSGGEQQMLSMARTLMTEPTVLLLDEPCEGIAPLLVESIRDALLQLRQEGMAMLVAEQNGVLADSADRVITLSAAPEALHSTES